MEIGDSRASRAGVHVTSDGSANKTHLVKFNERNVHFPFTISFTCNEEKEAAASMGFLSKLNKKKAEEPAVNSKAPIILVEDVSVDGEQTIPRNDSDKSQKSLEPDGIKTMESRD